MLLPEGGAIPRRPINHQSQDSKPYARTGTDPVSSAPRRPPILAPRYVLGARCRDSLQSGKPFNNSQGAGVSDPEWG